MAQYTPNIRLIKPDGNDYYNVNDFNQNAEIIDGKVKSLEDRMTQVQRGATKNTAGIVQYGAQEGKALEGDKINEILGSNSYGGRIDTPGQKYEGMAYYDAATKEMFICTQNTTSTTASANYFKPFSNKALLNRLENLYNYETLYSNLRDFGSYTSLTVNLSKPIDDSKYAYYIVYIGQSTSVSKSFFLTSMRNVELFFDTYQSSNPANVGTCRINYQNDTTLIITKLAGGTSGDGVTRIIGIKR